jgi:hypothetical protein
MQESLCIFRKLKAYLERDLVEISSLQGTKKNIQTMSFPFLILK